MNGDTVPGGTRTVTLPAVAVGNVPAAADENAFAGTTRESIVANGPGGAEVTATVAEPWQSAPTATRTLNGFAVDARHVGTSATHTRTTLDGGRAPRTTTSTTVFDDTYGMPVRAEDRGDDAVTGDERCVLTDYARNTSAWLVATVSRVRTFAVNCAEAQGGGLTADDIIGDERTSYDTQAPGVAPTKGEITRTERLKEYNAGTPTFLTTSTSVYDPYGRPTDVTDIRGNHTLTAYTPATGGPVTQVVTTNALQWTTTTTLEPAWAQEKSIVDTNGRRTDFSYDALGRLTGVWLPGRDTGQPASLIFDYLVRPDGASAVTKKALSPTGAYVTTYALYDGLGRIRQTQAPDAAGGPNAVITDTYYDTAGRVVKTHNPYLATLPPGTDLLTPLETIPSQTETFFDGAGRTTASVFVVGAPPASPGGTERWRTSLGYGGDRVDTTPPAGGTGTSKVVDARGATVALRQFHSGVAPGTTNPAGYDETAYTYDRKGQLQEIKDPAGARWTYGYDVRGRSTSVTDPDKGRTTTTYSDADDPTSTTDARDITVAYTYDTIGRRTTMRDGSETGPKRAEWTYDRLSNGTTVNGQLVKSTRYVGNDTYTKEVTSFRTDYQPASINYTIPSTETGLAGTYTYTFTYWPDGSPQTVRLPRLGDLGLETLTYGYNALGAPATLSTTLGGTYVTGTDYTSWGDIGAVHMTNNARSPVHVAQHYAEDTRRLDQILTEKETVPTKVADVRYSYDPAGNPTKVSDLVAGDHQCFRTDYARRLAEAWTPANGDCAAAPSTGGLATGAAAYWQSFTYDAAGNRTKQVEHATSAGARTTTYTIAPGKHAMTGTTTVDNAGTRTATYGYDPAGNTLTRPTTQSGTQALTWNAEGRQATSTDSTGSTSYIYDADGERLIRKDPGGRTLYLPSQELRVNNSGAPSTTRYYTHAGSPVAVRTAASLTWLNGDHQGTAQISIDAVSHTVAVRRQTPFGVVRGSTGPWPAAMDKGFLGGTADNTELTHLGAREYDPSVGRFVSVDPILDTREPQQMNGYNYANNTPVLASDPSGLEAGSWCNDSACAAANAKTQTSYPMLGPAASKGSDSGLKDCWWPSASCRRQPGTGGAGSRSSEKTLKNGTVMTTADGSHFINSFNVDGLLGVEDAPSFEEMAEGVDRFVGDNPPGGDFDRFDPAGTATTIFLAEINGYYKHKEPPGLFVAALHHYVPSLDMIMSMSAGQPMIPVGPVGGRGAGRRAEEVGCHSFDPDTPVLMADGSVEPIAQVQVGDEVLATDPVTGETQAHSVTALHANEDTNLVDLTVADGTGGTETLHTTQHHPFWDEALRLWVDAQDLRPGHRMGAVSGEDLRVVEVRVISGTRDMRDLTVDGVHTYYVVAGHEPVLVHNCPAGETAPFGRGGMRAPKAPSKRNPDAGTFRTRDQAWAAANRDREKYKYASPREECGPTECHVHLDVFNNKGQLLVTWHYNYHQR